MSRWWFKAHYIETCNCAHGCPCNLTQIPTHGGCSAVVAYDITQGECDGVDLAGLKLGYVASWPGPIHKGNGRGLLFIDERASPEQRAALEEIGLGRAGPGGCFEIFASVMEATPEVRIGPIEFELEGKRGRIKLGELAEATVGPIVGDMGDEADARMLLPQGFIWRDALLVNTQSARAKAPHLDFELANSNAFFSEVAYNV